MDVHPSVAYTPWATSSREKTDDIITFAHFEKGNLLSETRKDAEALTNMMMIQLCHH